MFGATELIVYLWFLPVTLCIIVPLVILAGWTVVNVVTPLFAGRDAQENQVEQVIEKDIFSAVRA